MKTRRFSSTAFRSSSQPETATVSQAIQFSSKALRILFLEDVVLDVELNERELRRAEVHFTSRVVETQSEFVQALDEFQPDVILADYTLPGFNALEALQIVHDRRFDIPFILVTGSQSEEVAVECMRKGVDDYILKSSLVRLPTAVLNALHKREAKHQKERAEERLRQTHQTLEAVISSSPVAIVTLDDQKRVRVWNHAAERIFGWLEEEIIDHELPLISEDKLQEFERLFSETTQRSAPQALELQLKRKDGSAVDVIASAAVLLDVNGCVSGHVAIFSDISERKLLEEQFRQSQKMEAVGRLAGGVAHDFNNMLTAIIGYSELLLAALDRSHPHRKEVEEIRKAGDRASSLTQQLLTFSRKQVIQPKVVNLNATVISMEEMLRRLIGEDIEFRKALESDLGKVRADPGQLEQVIMNLVVNARDAMPKGGRLTIETKNVELDPTHVRYFDSVKGTSYVLLAISDTGCGMDSYTQSHLFEPFFTTKDMGTGLGLSTVYGIVQQSGGHIWVHSKVDVGTTFKIHLPRVDSRPETATKRVVRGPVPTGTETILLVEDDEGVRNLIAATLEAQGYCVHATSHGTEALALSRKQKEPIHLMITDVVMPRMNGQELADQMSSIFPAMKVIFISGYTGETVLRHLNMSPSITFLQKPFTPDVLARKVRETLDSNSE